MKISHDSYEILEYDEEGIPIYMRERNLSAYPEYRALCHWHEDVELIQILAGTMDYEINGTQIHLKTGDVLFVNSRRLHYGYSDERKECYFRCLIFHPSLLSSNKKLAERYLEAVTRKERADYLLFCDDQEMREMLDQLYEWKQNKPAFYEMELILVFHKIWKKVYHKANIGVELRESRESAEISAQRKMVSYIYQNYSNNLSLEEIAEAGNVCRSKCCEIFKKYVGQSPMAFANTYRLERSQYLLRVTSMTVTDICVSCGFNHLSYFARLFQEAYGMSPRDYRKQHGENR